MLRRLTSIVLVGIACVAAVAGVVALWMDAVPLDSGAYAKAVASAWRHPAIRETTAEQLGQHIARQADREGTVAIWLPNAVPSEQTSIAREIQPLLLPVARGIAERYVESPEFETGWHDLSAVTHASVVGQLLGPGDEVSQPVVLSIDLSALASKVARMPPGVVQTLTPQPQPDRTLSLLEPRELGIVRQIVRGVHGRGALVLAVATSCILLGIAVSHRPVRTAGLSAIGLAVAVVGTLGAIAGARSFILYRMSDWHLTPSFIGVIFDDVTSPLRVALASMALAASAIAVLVIGLSRRVEDSSQRRRSTHRAPRSSPHH